MRWKTKDMFFLLSKSGSVMTDHPGGDYDTEAVVVHPDNCDAEFRVFGLSNDAIENEQDCEIQSIEVRIEPPEKQDDLVLMNHYFKIIDILREKGYFFEIKLTHSMLANLLNLDANHHFRNGIFWCCSRRRNNSLT